MADDEDYRRPGRDNPIYEMATGLSDLQLSILQELYNRPESMKGKPFYKRDETGQYYFNFSKGGAVSRGQGRVRKPKKFRVT